MPFSDLPPELLEKGMWAAMATAFTIGATMLVGMFGVKAKEKISNREDLTQRETLFIEHLQAEMARLKEQMADVQSAYQAIKQSRDEERTAYMEQIVGLRAEITMLKQRMSDEEDR